MLFGGGFSVLIPPTRPILRLLDYYKVSLIFNIVFVILCFMSTTWFSGVVSLCVLIFGIGSIRHYKDGISIQQVLIYSILCFILSTIFFVKLILFVFDVNDFHEISPQNSAFLYYLWVSVILSGPFIFSINFNISVKLYRELKNVVDEIRMQFEQAGGDMGIGQGQGQGLDHIDVDVDIPPASPSPYVPPSQRNVNGGGGVLYEEFGVQSPPNPSAALGRPNGDFTPFSGSARRI